MDESTTGEYHLPAPQATADDTSRHVRFAVPLTDSMVSAGNIATP